MTEKKYNIMLVDDDQFLVDMYVMKFNQGGHSIQPCFSVDEALDALHKGFVPDAIVFDLVMPVKDGFDLLRAVREDKLAPQAKLIALTNQGAEEERAKATELGSDEYVIKAMTIPSEVVKLVIEAIGKH